MPRRETVSREQFRELIEAGIESAPLLSEQSRAKLREFADTAPGCGAGRYERCPAKLAGIWSGGYHGESHTDPAAHRFALGFDRAVERRWRFGAAPSYLTVSE